MDLVSCTQSSGQAMTTYMILAPRETTACGLTWKTGAASTSMPSTRASGQCQMTNCADFHWAGYSKTYTTNCLPYIISCSVEDEEHQYRLHVSGFSGTVQDSFSWYHDKQGFSTPDSGNICAEISHGGWWYNQCFYAYLNGVYYRVRIHRLPRILHF